MSSMQGRLACLVAGLCCRCVVGVKTALYFSHVVAWHCAGDSSRGGSRPASAAGSAHSNATLQLLAEGSVEPAITAQAIKRRKAAAVRWHSGFACSVV